MKKSVIFVLFFMFAASLSAFAADTNAPELDRQARRAEVKKIKDQQRQSRKNGPSSTEKKWSDFWAKEGERSGLGNSGNRVGNFFGNLNPVPFFKSQEEQYKARKAAAKKS